MTPPLASGAPPARAWRTDLEGLRVVAILLVAGYHVWADRVSGGVDVFLLLSGFFVGGGLWRQLARSGSVNVRSYLARHAKRLLPASVTVLLGTAVVASLILPVTRWTNGAEQTLASLLWVENWWLVQAGQTYGSADPDQSPWQHFWSLSVQGQLFVTVPLVMLVAWWLSRRLSRERRLGVVLGVLSAVATASFVGAVVLTAVDQPTAYLHTATRAWEFLVGMLLAVLVERWTPRTVPLVAWSIAGWLGAAGLLTTGLLVDGATTFPGLTTLVPVGAAVIIVLAGACAPGLPISRALAWRPLAYAGRYAYAFYLWHWPILVLAVAARGRSVGWLAGTAVLVLAGVLAMLTHHLVEEPLRQGRAVRDVLPRWASERIAATARTPQRSSGTTRPSRLRTPAVCSGLVVVLALPTAWLGHVEVQRRAAVEMLDGSDVASYPGALSVSDPEAYGEPPDLAPIPDLVLLDEDKTMAIKDGCFVDSGSTQLLSCEYGDPHGTRTVAVVGGSHSEQWFGAIDAVGRANGMRVVPILKAGCPLSTPETADHPECGRWLERVIERLETDPPDFVVTTSTRPTGTGDDFVPVGYADVFARLTATVPVIALRDNPWLPVSMAECVASSAWFGDCDQPLYAHIAQDDPTAVLDLGNIAFLDLNDLVCPHDVCSAVQGNRYVYRDDNHLAASYVTTMAPALEGRLLDAMRALDESFDL